MAKSNEIKINDFKDLKKAIDAQGNLLTLSERQQRILASKEQAERLKKVQEEGGPEKILKKKIAFNKSINKRYDKIIKSVFPEEKPVYETIESKKTEPLAVTPVETKEENKIIVDEEAEEEPVLANKTPTIKKGKKENTKTAKKEKTAKTKEIEKLGSIQLMDGKMRNLEKGDKFYDSKNKKSYEITGPYTTKKGKLLIRAENVDDRKEELLFTIEEFKEKFEKYGDYTISVNEERSKKLYEKSFKEKKGLQEDQEKELAEEKLVTIQNRDDIPVNLRRGDLFWYTGKQYKITKEGTRTTKKDNKLLILAKDINNSGDILELTPSEFVEFYDKNKISLAISKKMEAEMKQFLEKKKEEEAKNSTPEKIEENVAKIAELIKEFGISQVVIHSGVDLEKKDDEDPFGEKLFYDEAYFKNKKQDRKFQNPWTPDLDTQVALLMLNDFNKKSPEEIYTGNAISSYIPKGGTEKNLAEKRDGIKLFIDVGGNWLRFEKDGENTTIYLDHHGEEKKAPTSAAEMIYKIMDKADLLRDKPEWLKKLVTFTNDVDNLSYLDDKDESGNKKFTETYFKETWPRSLYAIAEKIPFKILKGWFESGKIKNVNHVFTPEELKGALGKTKIRIREKLINGKMEVVDMNLTLAQLIKLREEEAGWAVKGINNAKEYAKEKGLNTENTRLGKVLFHDHFTKEDGKQNYILDNVAFTAAKSMGFDTIVNWDPKTKIFKINSSHENLEAIGKELQDEFIGTNIVRGVFIFGPKDKETCENINIERVLNIIDKNITKNTEPKLEESADLENSEEEKSKDVENTIEEKELTELEKLEIQRDANRIILIEAIRAGNRMEVARIQKLNFDIFKKKKELLNTKIENTENKEEVKIIEEIKDNNSETIENAIETQENSEKIELIEKISEDPVIVIEEKEKEIEISPSGILRENPEEKLQEEVESEGKEKVNEEIKETISELPKEDRKEILKNYLKEKLKVKDSFAKWIRNKISMAVSGLGEKSKPAKELASKLLKRGVLIAGIYFGAGFMMSAGAGSDKRAIEIDKGKKLEVFNPNLGKPIIFDQQAYEMLSINGKKVYELNCQKSGLSENKERGAYVIADKANGQVLIFNSMNKLVAKFPAIFGSAKGETPNRADVDSSRPGSGATTPMGTYHLDDDNVNSEDIVTYDGMIFGIQGSDGLALHITYPGELAARTANLEDGNPDNNNMSWGCINIDKSNFIEHVAPYIKDGAKLYILPDDPTTLFIPAF